MKTITDLAAALSEIELLRADAAAVQATLPGPYYMDPPDGGSVTVLEQLRRMAKDAERYRWLRRDAPYDECAHIFDKYSGDELDAALDAAKEQK